MKTPEIPNNKLTPEETEKLMSKLREEWVNELKKNPEYEVGDEDILLEIQREKGINLGRDYFSPIQIGELSSFFRIDELYIRNMSVMDAIILNDSYQTTYNQEYSDTPERLGKTEFELQDEAEIFLKKMHDEIAGKKDKGSLPPPPPSSRFGRRF